jgi:hypothetical protein
LGGTDGVPIALRRIDSTTEMRTNEVTISSANGTSDSAAIARISTSGWEANPASWPCAGAARAAAGTSIAAAPMVTASATLPALRTSAARRIRRAPPGRLG